MIVASVVLVLAFAALTVGALAVTVRLYRGGSMRQP
jgi:hypothetical protein